MIEQTVEELTAIIGTRPACRAFSAGQVNKGSDPEGYSIPGQREAAAARARSLGADVLEEYVEYGVSGRTTKRPALQRLLADLKTHRPTYVIIYDLSRLARNRLTMPS